MQMNVQGLILVWMRSKYVRTLTEVTTVIVLQAIKKVEKNALVSYPGMMEQHSYSISITIYTRKNSA